ncbi:helix-turn-helix domain-containing protein [Nocardia sp. NPDC052254]|uniref:PucR family transcriptional regulator n=1 Tax=Nocardia sp. NPDC052254 TaxID=3155681 RepID=UPI00342F1A51
MSLEDTVQDLADRLGSPLVALDLDLNVAAYSMHDTDARWARLARLLAGTGSLLTDAAVKEYGLRTATAPVRIPGEADVGVRVVMPLRHDKRLLGYLCFVDDHPDGDTSAQAAASWALAAASAEIGMLLALKLSEQRHSADHARSLLSSLFGDSALDSRHAADLLLQEGLIENVDHYSVLVFRAPEPSPKPVTRLAVEATLEFTARATTVKIIGAVLGVEGVVLFPRPVNHERLERALVPVGATTVIAGVGGLKRSLNEAVNSYREAQLACRAALLDPTRYGQRVFWEELGLDRLLLQLPLDHLTTDDFPPGIQRLLAAPNGRELAATLESYLDNGGEVARTARSLNIHRSTLYYRLDRIREVTGSDIADGGTRLDLHAGLRVARLAAMWPQT